MTPGPSHQAHGPYSPRHLVNTAPALTVFFLQLVGGSTGSSDLLLGSRGKGVNPHLNRDGDLAGTEDLDRTATTHSALGRQIVRSDLAPLGIQRGQLVQVHDLELDPVRVLEALELRNPADQRHLTALKTDGDGAAGLGALGTATGGLALGRLAATLTDLGPVGAGGRTQVVHLEGSSLGGRGLFLEISRHVSRPPRR